MEFTFSWTDLELIVRIFISVALGALIGFEREITRKPAGLRTHIFVCMGAPTRDLFSRWSLSNARHSVP